MKTELMKALCTMMLVLPFCGCQQSIYYEDEDDSEAVQKPVIFSGNIQTRVANNAWEDADKIGVYMLKSGTKLSSENILRNASNRQYVFKSGENVFAPATKSDTIYYAQELTDFIAYYPYTSVTDYSVPVNLSNQSDFSAIDLLYSNNLKGVSRSDSRLTLSFSHQLSKLIFLISAGEGYTAADLEGARLSVDDILTAGTFSLPDSLLTSEESSRKNITANINDAGTQAEAIVLPQACSGVEVRVTLKSGRRFLFTIVSTSDWSGKHKYTYKVVLNRDDYNVAGIEGTIDDWTDGGTLDLEANGNGVSTSVWDGTTIDTDWYAEEMTEYDLSEASELAGLAALVNNGVRFEGKTIRLVANIDLQGHDWTPIGYISQQGFMGVFDGGDYTISGLSPILTQDGPSAGLFGDNAGTIRNVTVNGTILYDNVSKVTCALSSVAGINHGSMENCCNYASVTGHLQKLSARVNFYVGGVVGLNHGTMSGCVNEGVVEAINDCVATGYNSDMFVGGVAGASSSKISNSENRQSVTCQGDTIYIGGIAGWLRNTNNGDATVYGEVENCANYGNVTITKAGGRAMAGGVVGQTYWADNTITGSYNYGEVVSSFSSETSLSYAIAGGIIGENKGSVLRSNSNSGHVQAVNSSNSDYALAGGIVGNNIKGGQVHRCVNETVATVEGGLYVGGIAGMNDNGNAYVYDCCVNNGLPLPWIGNRTGSGLKSDVTTDDCDN